MKNHEKAFSDIKNYYNDITLNNLALINSLKVIIKLTADVSRSACTGFPNSLWIKTRPHVFSVELHKIK